MRDATISYFPDHSLPHRMPALRSQWHLCLGVRWAFVAFTLVLLAMALYSPVNHDENQYVAGIAFGHDLDLYKDFLYLQPPGYPLLLGWLKEVAGENLVLALRLMNAALGVCALYCIYASLRLLAVGRGLAVFATSTALASQAFLFSSGVARNDLLPAALFAFAFLILVQQFRGTLERPWHAAIVGALFAMSGEIKQSYFVAVLPIGLALCYVAYGRREGAYGPRSFMAMLIGGTMALAPMVHYALTAWPAFYEGVAGYHLHGVKQWYEQMGLGELTTVGSNIWRTLLWSLSGSTLAVFLLTFAGYAVHRKKIRINRGLGLALISAVGGAFVAAILPTPSWPQYMIPLLIPLTILFGVVLKSLLPVISTSVRQGAWVMISIGYIAAGVFLTITMSHSLRASPLPTLLRVEKEAHLIGSALRQLSIDGPIATLSPIYVIDSGLPTYTEFASGPTFYRTADRLTDDSLNTLHAVAPRTVQQLFDRRPPAAILVGHEQMFMGRKIDLEETLKQYAVTHDYEKIRIPDEGNVVLYVQPKRHPKSINQASLLRGKHTESRPSAFLFHPSLSKRYHGNSRRTYH